MRTQLLLEQIRTLTTLFPPIPMSNLLGETVAPMISSKLLAEAPLATPADLRATQVLETWVGGEKVWFRK